MNNIEEIKKFIEYEIIETELEKNLRREISVFEEIKKGNFILI